MRQPPFRPRSQFADAAREYRHETERTPPPLPHGWGATNGAGAIRVEHPSVAAPPAWPEPKPLPTRLLPVAPFDASFLPSSIRPWVSDVADRMQCPAEYVAIPAVVALGAILGRKVALAPQQRTNWREVANCWGLIVGRPGAMKTPAADEGLKFSKRLDADASKVNEAAEKAHANDMALAKIRNDEALNSARAAIKGGEGAPAGFDLSTPEKPPVRRYIVSDTSYEALGEILADNPNGVLAHRDELVALLRTLDREDNAAARGFFLTAWSGTSGYTFDRIVRGRKHIPAACLSIVGGTQPGRIAEYMRRANAGGAGDDGLIQRFGLLVWPDQLPEWREVDCFPNSEARDAAWDTFTRLDELTGAGAGAEQGEFDTDPFLRFDAAAHGQFTEWRADLETRLRAGELSPALESHLSKYRKLVPSLALINHLADGGTGAVTEEATLRALAFAAYLETHARRAYAAGSEAETAAASAILKRIRAGDITDGFSARDVHQKGWANLSDRDQVGTGLNLLVDLDWLSPQIVQTGGRPRTVYAINPRTRS